MTRLLAILAFCVLAASPARADEQARLVQRGRSEAETLWRRGFTLGDSTLDNQLQRMLDTLTSSLPRPEGVELHAHVFRSPEINAFALPDGSIYVFAGLISELTTRDQLAFVLRHEAEHSLAQHALKNIGQAKAKVGALSVLSLASSVFIGSALVDALAQLGLGLAAAYSVNGYGRALEREADLAGVRCLASSKRNSCGSVEAFQVMLRRSDEPGSVTNFFWGNHPRLRDRIEYVEKELGGPRCHFDSLKIDADYSSIRWPMMKMTSGLWLAAGDRNRALRCAETYRAAFPADPEAHVLLGDSYAASDSRDTLRLAVASYGRAFEHAPAEYKPPLRGLARVSEKQGDSTACIGYLERYLSGDAMVRDRRSLTRKLEAMRAAKGSPRAAVRDSSRTDPHAGSVEAEKEE